MPNMDATTATAQRTKDKESWEKKKTIKKIKRKLLSRLRLSLDSSIPGT